MGLSLLGGKRTGVRRTWLFTASGTFTAPKAGRYTILAVGGGGGGSSGAVAQNNSSGFLLGGSMGGGSGQIGVTTVILAAGASVPLVIGAGGVGGASRSATPTFNTAVSGAAGASAGGTTVGTLIAVLGGPAGQPDGVTPAIDSRSAQQVATTHFDPIPVQSALGGYVTYTGTIGSDAYVVGGPSLPWLSRPGLIVGGGGSGAGVVYTQSVSCVTAVNGGGGVAGPGGLTSPVMGGFSASSTINRGPIDNVYGPDVDRARPYPGGIYGNIFPAQAATGGNGGPGGGVPGYYGGGGGGGGSVGVSTTTGLALSSGKGGDGANGCVLIELVEAI